MNIYGIPVTSCHPGRVAQGEVEVRVFDGASARYVLCTRDVRQVLKELQQQRPGEFELRTDGNIQYLPTVTTDVIAIGSLYGRICVRADGSVSFYGENMSLSIDCELSWVGNELRYRNEDIVIKPPERPGRVSPDPRAPASSAEAHNTRLPLERVGVGPNRCNNANAARRADTNAQQNSMARKIISSVNPVQSACDWAVGTRCTPSLVRRTLRQVFTALKKPGETLDTEHHVLIQGASTLATWHSLARLHASKFTDVTSLIDWSHADTAARLSNKELATYQRNLYRAMPNRFIEECPIDGLPGSARGGTPVSGASSTVSTPLYIEEEYQTKPTES